MIRCAGGMVVQVAELEAPVQALAAVPSVAPITYHVEDGQQLIGEESPHHFAQADTFKPPRNGSMGTGDVVWPMEPPPPNKSPHHREREMSKRQ
jgi:hypothetical protein